MAALASFDGRPGYIAGGTIATHAVTSHRAEGQHQRRTIPAVWDGRHCCCGSWAGVCRLHRLPWRPVCDPSSKDLGLPLSPSLAW